jgi:hypothetical protein
MTRYALVIGVSENQETLGLRPLSKTKGDAEAIAQVLRQHGDFQRVELLTQASETTWERLNQAILEFVQQRTVQGEALIYYTGHAFPLQKGFGEEEVFLAPADCQLEWGNNGITRQTNGLSLQGLNQLLSQANLSSLVLFLDCCHGGFAIEQALLQRTFRDRRNYGVLAAARPFEAAYARRDKAHSVFTCAILEGLQQEQANDRGEIITLSLFGFVHNQLVGEKQEVVHLSAGDRIVLVRYPVQTPDSQPNVSDTTVNPYQGLSAFTPETAQFFFGREAETRDLVQRVEQFGFVPVIGASGSGKSSLVRAGLVPRMQELGWRVLEPMRPGEHPIAQLKLTLKPLVSDPEAMYRQLDSQGLKAVIESLLRKERLLLIVDQFEEVFTLCKDRQEQSHFIQNLTSAYAAERFAIVTTMRADFIEPWLSYGKLTEAIQHHALFLPPLQGGNLQAAIIRPATTQNHHLQAGLLDSILLEVEEEPNSLPLLQFVLQQLWEKRNCPKRELTLAAYRELGKVKGALNRYADTVYQPLAAQGQGDWVRRVMLKLVHTGDGTQDTRQHSSRTDLLAIGKTLAAQQVIANIIQALVDGRLLVSDFIEGKDVIDLTHEALLQGWEKFAKWRATDRDSRRLVQRVEAEKVRGDLLEGRLLKDAQQLLKIQPEAFSANLQEFMTKSLQNQRRKQLQLVAWLVLPIMFLAFPTEYFWREETIRQSYKNAGDNKNRLAQREAFSTLISGCLAAKERYDWLQYIRERLFGNCRSLKYADLSRADLRGANLSYADLRGANLSGADLRGADLSGANLGDADLSGADLGDAGLNGANLRYANLSHANLSTARLRNAYLSRADLSNATLINAQLNADLRSANLSNANLINTDLESASFRNANLKNVTFGCDQGFDKNGGRFEGCTNLENIKWDKTTQWSGIKGWGKAKNIPPELKQQLGLK